MEGSNTVDICLKITIGNMNGDRISNIIFDRIKKKCELKTIFSEFDS